MRRWRVPLVLTALLFLAQVLHRSSLHDVVTGLPPAGVSLSWPLHHYLFAPLTLTADWLNGGGTGDLIGFAAWAVILFVAWRLFAEGPRRLLLEARALAVFAAAFGAFIWWGARWSRPIPRLAATDSTLIIFDAHSHTSASHDGRPGFGAAANASWHRRAGFDAAFVTDHNVFGAARQWRTDRQGQPPLLLDAEELSLSGLHLLVLGNDSALSNRPWNASFDSSLLLVRSLRVDSTGPLVVASLPEYWRYHWGADLGRAVEAGVEGLEIWTTSPRAMDFPPRLRREAIARARSLDVALVGATDMHGLGWAATVWNVASLPGWRSSGERELAASLVRLLRERPQESRVVALRRRLAATKSAQAVGVPLGLFELARTSSRGHALALLAWIWVPALLLSRRRPPAPR